MYLFPEKVETDLRPMMLMSELIGDRVAGVKVRGVEATNVTNTSLDICRFI